MYTRTKRALRARRFFSNKSLLPSKSRCCGSLGLFWLLRGGFQRHGPPAREVPKDGAWRAFAAFIMRVIVPRPLFSLKRNARYRALLKSLP